MRSARRWNARSTRNAIAIASTIAPTATRQSPSSLRKPVARAPRFMWVESIPGPSSGRLPDRDGRLPGRRLQAILLDALGTLMHFEPPAPLLRVALRERCGVVVSEAVAEAAMRAEVAYYRAHLDEG